jgi:hypothetical protein
MQVESSPVTETAACTVGNHPACRGTVYTLTTGLGSPLSPLSPCACSCHAPALVEDEELDDLLAEDADRRLDDEWIGAWS